MHSERHRSKILKVGKVLGAQSFLVGCIACSSSE